jgi:FdhD protein
MRETIGVPDMKGVTADVVCDHYSDQGWITTTVHVPSERELTIYLNRCELVTILCSPTKLRYLVLGFLYSEGIISGLEDLMMMRVCDDESEVDVRLKNSAFELPTKRRLTSGCGGGATFTMQGQRVDSDFTIMPGEVLSLMKQLQEQMDLYKLSGGAHTSALSDTGQLLIVAEDIGRHNTLDKIQGECLATGVSSKDRLILTTGRVSSEMLLKAARMQVPVVVSRHTPTASAVALARDLGITLAGHVRGGRLWVYSHPERLGRSSGEVQKAGRTRVVRAQQNQLR